MLLTLLGIVLLLLLIFILGWDRSWSNIAASSRNDIVFESKNKLYGAYLMRREYSTNLRKATFISLSVLSLAFVTPLFLVGNEELPQPKDVGENTTLIILTPNVKEAIVPIEQVKAIPQQNTKAQLQFNGFDVVNDAPSDQLPSQDKLDNLPPGDNSIDGPQGSFEPSTGGFGNIDSEDDKPVRIAEVYPEFPGGDAALFKFLRENIKYPSLESEEEIQGMVILTFVVDKEGKISQIAPLKEVKGGKGLTDEAIRVVGKMPVWKPGRMNGKPVSVQYNLPIRFVLN